MGTLLPDLASMVVGGIIWALGINIFTVPNDIAPGGATGIATVINHFTGFPVGVIIIIINIPLFILAFFFVGKRFTLKTAAAIVITSVILDVMGTFLPTFTEDKLLASIFGGVLSGVGLGIIYTRGIATGGSDLLARLIDERVSAISYAQTILLIDFIVVAAAAIAFADWRSALYAVITIALNSSRRSSFGGDYRGQTCLRYHRGRGKNLFRRFAGYETRSDSHSGQGLLHGKRH